MPFALAAIPSFSLKLHSADDREEAVNLFFELLRSLARHDESARRRICTLHPVLVPILFMHGRLRYIFLWIVFVVGYVSRTFASRPSLVLIASDLISSCAFLRDHHLPILLLPGIAIVELVLHFPHFHQKVRRFSLLEHHAIVGDQGATTLEIDDSDFAVAADQHMAQFDVAMQDPNGMEFFEGLNAPLLENDRHVRRSFYPEGMVRRFHGDVDFPWKDMDANDGQLSQPCRGRKGTRPICTMRAM